MAKSDIKYQGNGFGFPLALKPTGKQPLDTRTIVTSLPEYPSDFESSAAYEGMLVTLLGENGNHKIYVLENTLEEILTNTKLRWREAGGGSTVVSSYNDLIAFAIEDNIGKTVYLDTEVKNGSETYTPGLYVVIGDGSVNKLAATASGGQDLASLSVEISNIKTTISNLDASYAPIEGQYISGIEQVDGQIIVTRGDLPTTTDGGLSANIGTTYMWDAFAPIDINISYSNGAITNISVSGLEDVATTDYVNDKLNDEISKLPDVDEKITNAINNLDSEITLESNQFITGITQENGIISYYTFGTLPEIPEIESATVEGISHSTIFSYSDGQITQSQFTLSVSTDKGKVTKVEFSEFDDLVTKDYVDHMHQVLLGDNNFKDTIDTITEISYWLDNNPNDAVELTLSLAELTEKVNDIDTNVAAEISEINNKFSEYATIIYVDQEISTIYSYIDSRLSWDVI